ncbi:MAG: PAS domain-containing protein [Myxococcaceae bacterium]|nr:PAS domain-containing protein [Myxococcaceae bacterium]
METGTPARGDAAFGALLDAADVGAALLNAQGELVAANAVLQRLVGRRGLTVVEALRCAELASSAQPPWRHALAGEPSAVEVNVGTREDPLWLHACAEPVHDDEGRSIGVLVTFHPSARAPGEISPDEYLALVTHDLRHPLNNIYMRAQLLERELREVGDQHACEAISKICQNVQRMDAMIKELIDIHRAEGGTLKLQREAVDLCELARQTMQAILPPRLFEESTVRGDEPVWIEGDRRRLERVFANLLSNAAKFSNGLGPIRVDVRVSSTGDALASVSDSGPGIDQEALPHLFEKFFRARRSEDAFVGHGLGLYGSRKIVEAHGGHIWAESNGRGATFHLLLPGVIAPPERKSA